MMSNSAFDSASDLLLFDSYRHCELCPRRCGLDRTQHTGAFCHMSSCAYVARSALHFWEEPCISGTRGSGAVFFSGCPLRCVYCQNYEISQECFGIKTGSDDLTDMMCDLKDQGAHNINLVTATHFAPHVVDALRSARRRGMDLPVVWNTSGYERPELLYALKDAVDIWLFDFKYASQKSALELSGARDYPQIAKAALRSICSILQKKGGRLFGDDGLMIQGIIVRHLLLPGHTDECCEVLDTVWNIAKNEVELSVMNQYTPQAAQIAQGGPMAHKVDNDEYDFALCYADTLGFKHLIWQEAGSSTLDFVPQFDGTGVCCKKESKESSCTKPQVLGVKSLQQ